MHYRALPLASKVVEGLPEMQENLKEYARDVRKERTQRRHFQVARERQNESWKSFAPMYAGQCPSVH